MTSPRLRAIGLAVATLLAGDARALGDEGFGGGTQDSSCTVRNAEGEWVSCDNLLAPPTSSRAAEPTAPEASPDAGPGEGAEATAPPPKVDVRRFRKHREVGGPWADAFTRVRKDTPEVPLLAVRREARERDLDARQAKSDEKGGLLDEATRKRFEREAEVSARVRELIEVLALRRRERCLARSGKIELVEKMRLPRRTDLKLSHRGVRRQMALKDPPECRRVEFITSEDVEVMRRVVETEAQLAQPGFFASLEEKKAAETELERITEEVRGVIRRDPTRLETKAAKPEKIRRWGPTQVKQLNQRLRGPGDRDTD